MAVIEFENVSNGTVVLADRDGHYATVKPSHIVTLDDSLLSKECIAGPLRSGLLRITKGGNRLPQPGAKRVGQQKPTRIEESISHFAGPEIDGEGSPDVVSTFDREGSNPDAQKTEPSAEKSGKKKDKAEEKPEETAPLNNKMVEVGQKLVRRGRRKKLIKVEKPSKHLRDVPNDPKKRISNVIEVQGERPMPVNSMDDGARLIMASDIPGGAVEMPLGDALWDQLSVLSKKTDALVDGAAKDKKMALYATMDLDKREVFVNNTQDLTFLREVVKFEWTPDLARAIRDKIKELETTNVQ